MVEVEQTLREDGLNRFGRAMEQPLCRLLLQEGEQNAIMWVPWLCEDISAVAIDLLLLKYEDHRKASTMPLTSCQHKRAEWASGSETPQ